MHSRGRSCNNTHTVSQSQSLHVLSFTLCCVFSSWYWLSLRNNSHFLARITDVRTKYQLQRRGHWVYVCVCINLHAVYLYAWAPVCEFVCKRHLVPPTLTLQISLGQQDGCVCLKEQAIPLPHFTEVSVNTLARTQTLMHCLQDTCSRGKYWLSMSSFL